MLNSAQNQEQLQNKPQGVFNLTPQMLQETTRASSDLSKRLTNERGFGLTTEEAGVFWPNYIQDNYNINIPYGTFKAAIKISKEQALGRQKEGYNHEKSGYSAIKGPVNEFLNAALSPHSYLARNFNRLFTKESQVDDTRTVFQDLIEAMGGDPNNAAMVSEVMREFGIASEIELAEQDEQTIKASTARQRYESPLSRELTTQVQNNLQTILSNKANDSVSSVNAVEQVFKGLQSQGYEVENYKNSFRIRTPEGRYATIYHSDLTPHWYGVDNGRQILRTILGTAAIGGGAEVAIRTGISIIPQARAGMAVVNSLSAIRSLATFSRNMKNLSPTQQVGAKYFLAQKNSRAARAFHEGVLGAGFGAGGDATYAALTEKQRIDNAITALAMADSEEHRQEMLADMYKSAIGTHAIEGALGGAVAGAVFSLGFDLLFKTKSVRGKGYGKKELGTAHRNLGYVTKSGDSYDLSKVTEAGIRFLERIGAIVPDDPLNPRYNKAYLWTFKKDVQDIYEFEKIATHTKNAREEQKQLLKQILNEDESEDFLNLVDEIDNTIKVSNNPLEFNLAHILDVSTRGLDSPIASRLQGAVSKTLDEVAKKDRGDILGEIRKLVFSDKTGKDGKILTFLRDIANNSTNIHTARNTFLQNELPKAFDNEEGFGEELRKIVQRWKDFHLNREDSNLAARITDVADPKTGLNTTNPDQQLFPTGTPEEERAKAFAGDVADFLNNSHRPDAAYKFYSLYVKAQNLLKDVGAVDKLTETRALFISELEEMLETVPESVKRVFRDLEDRYSDHYTINSIANILRGKDADKVKTFKKFAERIGQLPIGDADVPSIIQFLDLLEKMSEDITGTSDGRALYSALEHYYIKSLLYSYSKKGDIEHLSFSDIPQSFFELKFKTEEAKMIQRGLEDLRSQVLFESVDYKQIGVVNTFISPASPLGQKTGPMTQIVKHHATIWAIRKIGQQLRNRVNIQLRQMAQDLSLAHNLDTILINGPRTQTAKTVVSTILRGTKHTEAYKQGLEKMVLYAIVKQSNNPNLPAGEFLRSQTLGSDASINVPQSNVSEIASTTTPQAGEGNVLLYNFDGSIAHGSKKTKAGATLNIPQNNVANIGFKKSNSYTQTQEDLLSNLRYGLKDGEATDRVVFVNDSEGRLHFITEDDKIAHVEATGGKNSPWVKIPYMRDKESLTVREKAHEIEPNSRQADNLRSREFSETPNLQKALKDFMSQTVRRRQKETRDWGEANAKPFTERSLAAHTLKRIRAFTKKIRNSNLSLGPNSDGAYKGLSIEQEINKRVDALRSYYTDIIKRVPRNFQPVIRAMFHADIEDIAADPLALYTLRRITKNLDPDIPSLSKVLSKASPEAVERLKLSVQKDLADSLDSEGNIRIGKQTISLEYFIRAPYIERRGLANTYLSANISRELRSIINKGDRSELPFTRLVNQVAGEEREIFRAVLYWGEKLPEFRNTGLYQRTIERVGKLYTSEKLLPPALRTYFADFKDKTFKAIYRKLLDKWKKENEHPGVAKDITIDTPLAKRKGVKRDVEDIPTESTPSKGIKKVVTQLARPEMRELAMAETMAQYTRLIRGSFDSISLFQDVFERADVVIDDIQKRWISDRAMVSNPLDFSAVLRRLFGPGFDFHNQAGPDGELYTWPIKHITARLFSDTPEVVPKHRFISYEDADGKHSTQGGRLVAKSGTTKRDQGVEKLPINRSGTRVTQRQVRPPYFEGRLRFEQDATGRIHKKPSQLDEILAAQDLKAIKAFIDEFEGSRGVGTKISDILFASIKRPKDFIGSDQQYFRSLGFSDSTSRIISRLAPNNRTWWNIQVILENHAHIADGILANRLGTIGPNFVKTLSKGRLNQYLDMVEHTFDPNITDQYGNIIATPDSLSFFLRSRDTRKIFSEMLQDMARMQREKGIVMNTRSVQVLNDLIKEIGKAKPSQEKLRNLVEPFLQEKFSNSFVSELIVETIHRRMDSGKLTIGKTDLDNISVDFAVKEARHIINDIRQLMIHRGREFINTRYSGDSPQQVRRRRVVTEAYESIINMRYPYEAINSRQGIPPVLKQFGIDSRSLMAYIRNPDSGATRMNYVDFNVPATPETIVDTIVRNPTALTIPILDFTRMTSIIKNMQNLFGIRQKSIVHSHRNQDMSDYHSNDIIVNREDLDYERHPDIPADERELRKDYVNTRKWKEYGEDEKGNAITKVNAEGEKVTGEWVLNLNPNYLKGGLKKEADHFAEVPNEIPEDFQVLSMASERNIHRLMRFFNETIDKLSDIVSYYIDNIGKSTVGQITFDYLSDIYELPKYVLELDSQYRVFERIHPRFIPIAYRARQEVELGKGKEFSWKDVETQTKERAFALLDKWGSKGQANKEAASLIKAMINSGNIRITSNPMDLTMRRIEFEINNVSGGTQSFMDIVMPDSQTFGVYSTKVDTIFLNGESLIEADFMNTVKHELLRRIMYNPSSREIKENLRDEIASTWLKHASESDLVRFAGNFKDIPSYSDNFSRAQKSFERSGNLIDLLISDLISSMASKSSKLPKQLREPIKGVIDKHILMMLKSKDTRKPTASYDKNAEYSDILWKAFDPRIGINQQSWNDIELQTRAPSDEPITSASHGYKGWLGMSVHSATKPMRRPPITEIRVQAIELFKKNPSQYPDIKLRKSITGDEVLVKQFETYEVPLSEDELINNFDIQFNYASREDIDVSDLPKGEFDEPVETGNQLGDDLDD